MILYIIPELCQQRQRIISMSESVNVYYYKNGSHFSAKFGIKMGLLFKSQRQVPTQIILE